MGLKEKDVTIKQINLERPRDGIRYSLFNTLWILYYSKVIGNYSCLYIYEFLSDSLNFTPWIKPKYNFETLLKS